MSGHAQSNLATAIARWPAKIRGKWGQIRGPLPFNLKALFINARARSLYGSVALADIYGIGAVRSLAWRYRGPHPACRTRAMPPFPLRFLSGFLYDPEYLFAASAPRLRFAGVRFSSRGACARQKLFERADEIDQSRGGPVYEASLPNWRPRIMSRPR